MKNMNNRTKGAAIITLLITATFLAIISVQIASVRAQSQATVTVSDVIGGTVDPPAGTYSYDDGSGVVFTATADINNGYQFSQWVITSSSGNSTDTDNPMTLTVAGGTTYTVSAVFYLAYNEPIPAPNPAEPTPVIGVTLTILHAVGGATDPPEGTYYFPDISNLKITAIPDEGWKFDHWVISGTDTSGHGGAPFTLTPTDNPYTIGHGTGYTFSYQPVFISTSSSGGGGGTTGGLSTTTIAIIAAVVIIVAIVAAVGGYYYAKSRSQK